MFKPPALPSLIALSIAYCCLFVSGVVVDAFIWPSHACHHVFSRIRPVAPTPITRPSPHATADANAEQDEDIPLFSQSSDEIYAELTSQSSSAVGLADLSRWVGLQELVDDGEILLSEIEQFYQQAQPDGGGSDEGLDRESFAKLYAAIDDLFEDDDAGSEDVEETASAASAKDPSPASTNSYKSELNDLLSLLADVSDDPDTLPFGLECRDTIRDQISHMIETLRNNDANIVKYNSGIVDVKSLLGSWSLLYTSSLTMIINKSLSGLGRSTSDGAKIGGLTMKFSGTKYYGECTFVEKIDAGPEASFDVVVDGEWELKEGIDPYSGDRVTILKADPKTLEYPGNKAKADDWASLGPIKMLDILLIMDDILILRGITLTGDESIFVWQKDP